MTPTERLDAAAAAREVAMVVALALIQAAGDPTEALATLEFCADRVQAEGDELDCSTIGAQAIRDALALRGGT